LSQSGYEKRANRGPSRTIAAGAERRFLAPGKRRDRDQKVERIVAVAQEGCFGPSLSAGPPKLRRNLVSLRSGGAGSWWTS
jgi:hypothetical protein